MHEFRSCELLLPWRLKTNDLRDYLQVPRHLKRSWRYFLPVSSLFFFFMNFAICRLMTCLPLLWKNDQVDRKERIGCNCNVRFVTMRKKLNPTFSVRDLGFFLHSGRNLSFLSHQNNAKLQKFKNLMQDSYENSLEKHLNFHAKISQMRYFLRILPTVHFLWGSCNPSLDSATTMREAIPSKNMIDWPGSGFITTTFIPKNWSKNEPGKNQDHHILLFWRKKEFLLLPPYWNSNRSAATSNLMGLFPFL